MTDGVKSRLTIREDDLPNFQKVSPTLYRGGQPSHNGFLRLKELGVNTIVNLRDEFFLINGEAKLVENLGLRYLSIPLSPFEAPSEKSIELFLAALHDQHAQPHFVHCQHGQDRTGTMMSIFRLLSHDWTIDRAYEEMLELGFHDHFSHLKKSVFDIADLKRTKT